MVPMQNGGQVTLIQNSFLPILDDNVLLLYCLRKFVRTGNCSHIKQPLILLLKYWLGAHCLESGVRKHLCLGQPSLKTSYCAPALHGLPRDLNRSAGKSTGWAAESPLSYCSSQSKISLSFWSEISLCFRVEQKDTALGPDDD